MNQNDQNMVELQLLEQDLEQIQKNLQTLEQQLFEMEFIKKNLDEFSKQKKSEGLMTIANGIFAKTKIEETKELLVNVGSNVIVKKSIPETKKLLDEQADELKEYKEKMIEQMNNILFKIQELQGSIQKSKE